MAIIKCKMCGGDLNLVEGSTVCECEYCGTKQTVPSADNEKKLTLFGRAGRLLRACEFDKAAGVFETIVADFPQEAEAYWGLVLCKYGIEYVDDPATGKKIPTCHRSSFDSVLDDPNFEQACENTDAVARRVYRDEARQIEELRQAILQVSGKEEPYDVFISYKETDENGDRTLDSVIAQDVYKELTNEGYRVFFSRISLEDKLGTEYEPYIFAALNSAKVMLVVGTDYENFDAVWVKNEWSRFLKLIAKGEKKTLIPVFKNMDAYDMPKEFAKLSAQDMGKVGAMQDLVRGVEKILGKKKAESVKETVVVSSSNASSAPLLERAFMFLEDGDWKNASEYCEKVLDLDPKNAKAYIGKLMSELHVCKSAELAEVDLPFDDMSNYQKAVRFADAGLKETLKGYIDTIKDRNEKSRLEGLYLEAVYKMNSAKSEAEYRQAEKLFEEIKDWKDSTKLADLCCEKAEACRKNDIYARAKQMMVSSSEQSIVQAASMFSSLSGWKDAEELAKQCPDLAETARKNKLYAEAISEARKLSVDSLTSSIRKMKSLGDWKDAPQKVNEYEIRLESAKKQLYEAAVERKKRAEEAEQREAMYKQYLEKYPEKKNESKYRQELSEVSSRVKEAKTKAKLGTFAIVFYCIVYGIGLGFAIWLHSFIDHFVPADFLWVIWIAFFCFINVRLLRDKNKYRKKYNKEKAIEKTLQSKIDEIAKIPPFEEPYLQSGSSIADRSTEKYPQNDLLRVKEILAEMREFDEIDKRAYLADALADDRITDEEYNKILEIMEL